MHINQWFSAIELLSPSDCDKVLALCENIEVDQARVLSASSALTQRFARNCKSGWLLKSSDNEWLYNRITNFVLNVNKRTLKFDLSGGEVEQLQYLEYGFGQFYDWHTDNGNDAVANRKWTVVIQLSDPDDYLGGNLQIYSDKPGQRLAPRWRGAAAVFPSHLRHKAHPVWLGKRKALVAWLRGKNPLS